MHSRKNCHGFFSLLDSDSDSILVILCSNFHATRSPIQAPNLVPCALLPVIFSQACVKNSVHREGGRPQCMLGCTPLGRHHPSPVLSLNCHSTIHTQTRMQTEPEAYRMHFTVPSAYAFTLAQRIVLVEHGFTVTVM